MGELIKLSEDAYEKATKAVEAIALMAGTAAFVSPSQAAKVIGISPEEIRQRAKGGIFPYLVRGKSQILIDVQGSLEVLRAEAKANISGKKQCLPEVGRVTTYKDLLKQVY